MFKRLPLPAGFMIIGIVGMIIFSIKLSYQTINLTWGFLMLILSIILFASSILSITPELPDLSVFEKEHDKEIDAFRKFIKK